MPLKHSKTPAAFKQNIKTEMEHGKPQKQAIAIAYSEKAKAEHKKHLAAGGKVAGCEMCYSEGGRVSDDALASEGDNDYGISSQGRDVRSANNQPTERGKEAHMKNARAEAKGRAKFERDVNKPNIKGLADGGEVSLDDPASNQLMEAEFKQVTSPKKSQSSGLPGMAEGGEVEHDDDSELHDAMSDELLNCIHGKDKKGIMHCIQAMVLSMKNKG